MKIINENGKHKLRRSDRIRKNVQIKLFEDDPYHFHKRQCNALDVLERKIQLLQDRLDTLSQQVAQNKSELKEVADIAVTFPWDIVIFVLGIGFMFYLFEPKQIPLVYAYQPAIESSAETL
jgi:hypothetical protein